MCFSVTHRHRVLFIPNTIRHIIITCIFCFDNYSPIKVRTVTHKITPTLLTNIFQVLFALVRNRVFKSNLNLKITQFGVAHPKVVGELISGRVTHNIPNNYTNFLGEFNKQ